MEPGRPNPESFSSSVRHLINWGANQTAAVSDSESLARHYYRRFQVFCFKNYSRTEICFRSRPSIPCRTLNMTSPRTACNFIAMVEPNHGGTQYPLLPNSCLKKPSRKCTNGDGIKVHKRSDSFLRHPLIQVPRAAVDLRLTYPLAA